jgi:hypothetical protein
LSVPETRLRRFGAWAASEGWVLAAAVVLSTLATFFALELWRADFSIPMGYTGDAVYIAAHAKTDVMRGWYEWEPLLAAPFGQSFHDYKAADNLNHAFIALAGRFTTDWAWVENMYYLAGFPLAALTGAAFMRRVGVARPLAVVLAVCFAIAPYHFVRQEAHLWLSSYWALPLAMIVVYWVATGQPVWSRGYRSGPIASLLLSRATFTLIALGLVASTNSYYGFFAIIFIAIGGLVRVILDRNWRRFAGAFVASAWTAIVMLANMLPDMIFALLHGPNAAAVSRFPVESEVYALKLTQLILPMHGHRFAPFDAFRSMYDTIYPFPSGYPALGMIGSVGLLAALLVVITRAIGSTGNRQWPAIGVLSGLTLFGLLVASLGGASTVVSFFTSDLRGWDRMSIVLTLFTLAILGLFVTALATRFESRLRSSARTAAVWAIAGLLLIVGFWDQTSPKLVPDYEGIAAEFASDATLVDSISHVIGADASVLQVPLIRFPESAPVNGVPDTDQIKPFLHSDTLHWSGGAIKGRASTEWQVALERLPSTEIPLAIAAAGFDGVLLDLRTATDERLRPALIEGFGVPVLTSHGGRFEFYDTRDLRDSMTLGGGVSTVERLGYLVSHAVFARFSPSELDGWSIPETLQPYRPQIVFENPRTSSAEVSVAFDLTNVSGTATVRLILPDGTIDVRRLGPAPTHIELDLIVPPGASSIAIESVGDVPLERAIGTQGPLAVSSLEARDPVLADLLRTFSRAAVG